MPHRNYTYRIDEAHLPKGASACIAWALTQWAKASKGRIQFFQSHGSPDIMFSGALPPPNPKDPYEAYHYPLGNGAHSIIFSTAVTWATTWYHRTFTNRPDLRILALHEVGHVLLGPEHSPSPDSIMFHRPSAPTIDSASAAKLYAR